MTAVQSWMEAGRGTRDPATLDIIGPEHYAQNGYPHAEWTWLRQNEPVFWYERPNVEPFWAITKHEDIMAIERANDLFLSAPRPLLATAATDDVLMMTPRSSSSGSLQLM